MLKKHPLNLLAAIFAVFILSNCTPNLSEPLLKIQETNFASGWKKLDQYPVPHGRSDDLHFFSPDTGFVINSGGYLSYTEDGGESWKIVHENPETFFRCITFKNRQTGWLGTIGADEPLLYSRDTIALYETNDGGLQWTPVQFIGPTPKGLCGLQKVTDDFIVGCGRVRGPSFFIKTTDGGKNWYSYDFNHLAGSLIATHFFDESRGLLIGGTTRDKKNCRSMVLETIDGGITWDTIYISEQKGEYPWKFSFPTKEKGYISIQRNVRDGRFYHLESTDGGKSWEEVEHIDEYYYVQGIGFINDQIGWMGGTRSRTLETRDGGKTWNMYRDIGSGFNNFQFFNDSIAYGTGFGVYKSENIFKGGFGKKESYYADGTLRSTFQLRAGKKNGAAEFYHQNGRLAGKGFYQNNLRVQEWIFYDEKGNLTEKVKMKNGVAKVSSSNFKTFVGEYKVSDKVTRKVFINDGQLYTKRNGGEDLILYPESANRFFYGFNSDVTIEFILDRDGNVIHSKTFQGGKFSIAKKL